MIARLRFALALQAIGIALPLAAAVLLFASDLAFHHPCESEVCFPLSLWLLGLAIFLFAGPFWWAASSARRAPKLRTRQLAWLITVNVYLIVTAAFLYSVWTEPARYLGVGRLVVVLPLVLVPPALLSTAFCIERIWRLRPPRRAGE